MRLRLLASFACMAMLATFSNNVHASSWEETSLAVQVGPAEFVTLYYNGDSGDVFRYATPVDIETNSECTLYGKKPELVCTKWSGKRVRQVYAPLNLASEAAAPAKEAYRRLVEKGLRSSAPTLEQAYRCANGCDGTMGTIILVVLCAECGMEESVCMSRWEKRPTTAEIVVSNWVNMRASPDLKSNAVGRLVAQQRVEILAGSERCTEIPTPYPSSWDVGRWVKIRTIGTAPTLTGWVFDAYLRYPDEE